MNDSTRILALVFFAFAVFSIVESAPLRFVPQTVRQPDGAVLHCFASGDEYYSWLHDKDGFTIVQDEYGYYVYAEKRDGLLFPTQHIVGRANPSALGIEKWLSLDKRYILDKLEQHLTLTTQLSKRAGISTLALAPTKGTLINVVVFVRFADETEFTQSPAFFSSLFNNTASAANSVYNYYSQVSYGQLKIQSKFYTDSNAVFVKSYKDQYVRNYYIAYSITNQIGYKTGVEKTEREHALLTNAINAIKGSIPTTENLDADNDGNVDNVCFIAKGSPEVWSSLLWPHMSSLDSRNVLINGKKITTYNFQLENTLLQVGVGVLCHEMFHSLGAPDLYHYSLDALSPVSRWDLMEETLDPPQHMSAYMKYRYGKWISTIQEISSSGKYYLNPLTSSTNNCFKISSPNSATEYFVLEYRKKSGTFERSLPSEGLLVYRINRNSDGLGNAYTTYDELYVYRPKGSPSNNGEPDNASFSQNSGRVVINDYSDPAALLSDGLPGGLDIFNIGAISDSIGFELTKAGPYKLALTSPIGGENFKTANQTMITWMNQSVSEIKIELTVDGIHWETVATVTGQAGVSSGKYLWQIPSTPTSTAKIRISDAHDGNVYSISRNYFVISSTGQLIEQEPNNSIAQATPISIGDTYEGEISPEGDADYYRFNASAGDTIDVFANAKNSTLGGRIQVLDASGFISYDDGAYNNLATRQRLSVLIPRSGVYCIRYAEAGNWGSTPGSQTRQNRLEGLANGDLSSVTLTSTTVGRYQISLQKFKKTPPDFADAGAWNLTQNSAVLYFNVQENGCISKYTFEYGTSNYYGNQIDQQALAPLPRYQQNPIKSTNIVSLLPNTTYHFRLKAASELGTFYSRDATFTTAGEPVLWERRFANWKSQLTGWEGPFFKFVPFDKNNGIVFCDYALFKTHNGGVTWEESVPYPVPQALAASFVSMNLGWIAGESIHKTTDGGATWTKQDKPIDKYLTSVCFVDGHNGTAVGWQGCILHTTDGGNHWTSQHPADLPGMWERLLCVDFCDANHGIAVGTGGLIYTTTNAGTTWTKQQTGTQANLAGVHMVNPLIATVVGDGPCGGSGAILRTTDGGTTWVSQNNPTGNYINSVDFYNERIGLCVGINGSIARTSDGGNTWVAQESGVRSVLECVTFIDSSRAVVTGGWGVVLETKDAKSKSLVLLSPQGDEAWRYGSVQPILWQKNNLSKIDIAYSTDDGSRWNNIAKNIPASFSVYSWLIPNTISNYCRIRICDADDSTCVSQNSAPFAIIGPGPRFKASVTLLDFGKVGFGRSKDTVLVIRNTGDDTLRLSYPSVIGNGFSLTSFGPKIEPGNLAALGLRFEALAIDETSGLVIFSSNAASSPDTIALKGIGVQVSAIDNALSHIPEEYSIAQNYPNPFNPSTTIRFGLPARSSVRLTIYNMLGQLVASLVNCEQNAGWHQVRWDATVSSGLYFYRIEAISVQEPNRRFVEAKKMIVVR